MTRTDRLVSSRPQTADAASITQTTDRMVGGFGRRARRRIARRELLVLPALLALMVSAPALALGAETSSTGTSGYNQKPPVKTTVEPKKEVEPSKEATTPKTSTTPTTATEPATSTTPTTTTVTPKASTLPFTGLNLTWVVGAGVLLLAAGLSIRLALRQRPGAGG